MEKKRPRDPLSNRPRPPPGRRPPIEPVNSKAQAAWVEVPDEHLAESPHGPTYAHAPAEEPAPAEDPSPAEASEPAPERSIPAVPRLSADTHHGDDCLGVEHEARAFARIICARQTGTPLSIGLFGDWGSGKSFFMDRMQREIEARGRAFARVAGTLEQQDDPAAQATLDQRWHGRVAQITFNAWHYAEPNLWASLVTRVFDELAALLNPEESVEATRARLLAEVSEGRQRREQAQLELRKAEQQLAQAEAERDRREAELAELRDELAVIEAVTPGEAATPAATTAAPPRLTVGGPLAALRVTLRWVWSRGRWTRVGLVVAGLLLLLGAVLAVAWWRQWIDLSPEIAMATSACGVLVGIVSTLSAWILLIYPKLQSARRAHAALVEGKQSFLHRALGDLLRPGEGPAQLARRRFEATQVELRSAVAAAEQAAEQLARSRRLLQQLEAGRRFYDFVSERDQSDDYRRHLGLVSLIRQDFERLEHILSQVEREGPAEGDGPPPISRIVLYIDDLDRCEPERVVEVLQAVHLLLATPIFVVVLAADVRWLRRSLTLHYDRLLLTPRDGEPDHPDEARPTPKNYLEKIFQIPFSLRPMGAEGFSALVHDLVEVDRAAADQPAGAPAPAPAPDSPLSPLPPSSPPPPPYDPQQEQEQEQEQERERERERELICEVSTSLDPAELEFLPRLHAVIDTPRLAKALVNTYRLLRAELASDELEGYLAQQQYRGVLTLLAIQVGRSRQAPTLFEAIERGSGSTLDGVVAALADQHPEHEEHWRDLHAALASLTPEGLPTRLLQPWLDRIRRFSFNPWPAR